MKILLCSTALWLVSATMAVAQTAEPQTTPAQPADPAAVLPEQKTEQLGSPAAQINSDSPSADANNGSVAQPPVANAQSGQLDDIVVVAQKRSENLQRIPIAITAVAPEALTSAGVQRIADLGSAVPGLALLDIGGQISARIRGIGTTSINPGTESPVAIVIDGVYYASSSDVGGDVPDVAQVAVLKGPQGTLFGRNAVGGVVQITTRVPTDKLEIDASTGIDNYATSRSNLFVGGPVSSDGLRMSLALQYVTQGKGWGVNEFSGRDVHKINNNVLARAKAIYDFGPNTTVSLSGDYQNRSGSTCGVYRTFPGFPAAYASQVAQPRRRWDIVSYIEPYCSYSGGGASMTIDHDVGFGRITSITGFRKSKQFWRFNPAVTAVPSLDLELSDFSRQITQELQLVSKQSSPLTWAVGVYYIYNDAGQRPQIVNIRPGPYRGNGPFSQILTDTRQRLDSIAGYGQATYAVTDTTRLTGGFRYTYERKRLRGATDAISAASGAPISLLPFGTQTQSEERPTWRVSIDQDLGERLLAYASYNRGYKSGGFNTRDPSNPPFAAETLDAYELGLKSGLFGNRLRLNAGGFYYDYRNVQVARYTNTTVIYNGAAAELYGLDLEAQAQVTDRLSLNASMSLLHSEFTDFPNAFTTSFVQTPQGATITRFQTSAAGNRLPYSAPVSYNISVDYKLPTGIGPVALNFTDSYGGAFYTESDNVLRQRSYHYLNTSVAWQTEDEKFGVRLFVNNILDEAVVSQGGSLESGYEADYPSPPRTYGIRLQYKY